MHICCPGLQLLVQHAPPLHAPLAQVVLADSYTQFCESFVHVASVAELAHALPTVLHTESGVHAHAAVPAAPVQPWCAPQATGTPYARQPLLPRVQVARPTETQAVCPCVQLSPQVSEHEAPGAMPEQDLGVAQVDVDAT